MEVAVHAFVVTWYLFFLRSSSSDVEDMFDIDDDWAIYRKTVTITHHVVWLMSHAERLDIRTLQLYHQMEKTTCRSYRWSSRNFSRTTTFGIEQTHAALSSQRSAFLSAFRPQYLDSDVEGVFPISHET
jgi:actin-related protein 5